MIEEEKKTPNIKNPWLSVWLFPELTIAKILSLNPKYGIYMLGSLGGVLQAMNLAEVLHAKDIILLGDTFLMVLIFGLGSILGILNMYLTAYVLKLTGKWFNIDGKAKYSDLVAVVAWANIVAIPFIAIYAVEILFFGMTIFTKIGFEEMVQTRISEFLTMVQAFFQVWYIVMFVKMIRCVQQIKTIKAVFNMLLMLFALVCFAMLLSMIIMGVTGVSALPAVN